MPTDFLYFFLKNYDFWPIIRCNRFMKINRVVEVRTQTEASTNHPYLFRIISNFTGIIMIIHWNACLFYVICKYTGSFGVDFSDSLTYFEPRHLFVGQYIRCFYRSILQLTTISNLEKPLETTFEMVYMIISYLVGVLLFAVIVGSVTDIIDDLNIDRRNFQEKIDGVKNYMEMVNVNKSLQERVIKWFNHSWMNNSGMDEQLIFQQYLPENLQAEIAINIHLETLKKVNIFQDCEPGLLQQLVTRLRLIVFSPNDFVCKKGDIGREMYFIKNGNLNVVSDDGSVVFVTLKAGAYFGEISILDIPGSKSGNRRTANVRSVGYSDIFSLTKQDLWQALAEYPLAKKTLMEKGRALLSKDNLIDIEVARRAEELESKTSNLNRNLFVIKRKLNSLDKHHKNISDLIKAGTGLLENRIKKLEDNITAI